MSRDPRAERLAKLGSEPIKVLGKGQFGVAFLVKAEKHGECVAKVVNMESLAAKDQDLARQEVELLKKLQHPYIVGYIEDRLLDSPHELLIWMEFCDSGELRRTIRHRAKLNDRLPEPTLLRWFGQLALAVDYIHSQHILHRDLKTSNIFHSGKDVKIGDFGISRVLEGTIDAAATVVGTPYYMSPEVCRSEPYSYKSDVWALGCVLYEMCMLRHTFESDCLLGLVYKIVSDNYEEIPDVYSAGLSDLVSRLLDKDQATRYSARDAVNHSVLVSVIDELSVEKGRSLGMDKSKRGSSKAAPQPPAAAGVVPRKSVPSLAPGGQKLNSTSQQGQVAQAPAGLPLIQPGAAPRGRGSDVMSPAHATTDVTPTSPTRGPRFADSKTQEERARCELLLHRLRPRLARPGRNWMFTFAELDEKKDGRLSRGSFMRAMQLLDCGLAPGEVAFVFDAICESEGREEAFVSVNAFGVALRTQSAYAQEAEARARAALSRVVEGSRRAQVAAGAKVRDPGQALLRELVAGALGTEAHTQLVDTRLQGDLPDECSIETVQRLLDAHADERDDVGTVLDFVPKTLQGHVDIQEFLFWMQFQPGDTSTAPTLLPQSAVPGPPLPGQGSQPVAPPPPPPPQGLPPLNVQGGAPPHAAISRVQLDGALHRLHRRLKAANARLGSILTLFATDAEYEQRVTARARGSPEPPTCSERSWLQVFTCLPLGVSRAEAGTIFAACVGRDASQAMPGNGPSSFSRRPRVAVSALEELVAAASETPSAVNQTMHKVAKTLPKIVAEAKKLDTKNHGLISLQSFRIALSASAPFAPHDVDALLSGVPKAADGDVAYCALEEGTVEALHGTPAKELLNVQHSRFPPVPPRPGVALDEASLLLAGRIQRKASRAALLSADDRTLRSVFELFAFGASGVTRDVLLSALWKLPLGLSREEAAELTSALTAGETGPIAVAAIVDPLSPSGSPDAAVLRACAIARRALKSSEYAKKYLGEAVRQGKVGHYRDEVRPDIFRQALSRLSLAAADVERVMLLCDKSANTGHIFWKSLVDVVFSKEGFRGQTLEDLERRSSRGGLCGLCGGRSDSYKTAPESTGFTAGSA